MSFERTFTLNGRWKAILESGGVVKQEVEGPNVICTNGKEFLASFLASAAAAASTFTCKYVAIGTDSTAEAAAQTALGTELARTTGTVSYVSNQIYQVTATFSSGTGTGAITEYGLFSSSTGGTMLSRDVEAVINKGANDSLTTVLQITIS
jgi:basic membrane lipoprotein Med (substrate-binding protein (PBP1-ABC) superfamily)